MFNFTKKKCTWRFQQEAGSNYKYQWLVSLSFCHIVQVHKCTFFLVLFLRKELPFKSPARHCPLCPLQSYLQRCNVVRGATEPAGSHIDFQADPFKLLLIPESGPSCCNQDADQPFLCARPRPLKGTKRQTGRTDVAEEGFTMAA